MELLNGLQIHGDVGESLFSSSPEKIKLIFAVSFSGSCTIYEVDKIEGEASANNRKAKLIFFYEWTLSMKWKVCWWWELMLDICHCSFFFIGHCEQ